MKQVAAFAVSLFFCSMVNAQAPGTGAYPFASFDNRGFDSINLGNNNIRFTIPIVSSVGRGLAFNYAIQYEGLIWNPVANGSTTAWVPDPTWGFTGLLNGTALSGFMTHEQQINTDACPVVNGRSSSTVTYYNYEYHDSFGVVHPFDYNYTTKCLGSETGPTVTGQGPSPDGSGYSLNGSSASGVLTDRRGVLIQPGASATGQDPSSRMDANGNQINFDGVSSFTDTTGKTALTISEGNPVTFTYPVALQAGGATSATVVLSYKSYSVRTNFGVPGTSEYGSNTVNLVDRITLPDASFYAFSYEPTPGTTTGEVTGRIASVTLPTGATIAYTYNYGWSGSVNTDGTPAGLKRTTSDGVKEYDRDYTNYPVTTTYVKDEKGNETYLSFIAGVAGNTYETSRSVYQGAKGSQTPLLAASTTYNGQQSPTSAIGPITERDVSTTYNGIAQVTVANSYDVYGNLTGVVSKNGTSILQSQSYSYNSLNELTTFNNSDGANNTIDSGVYGYDESSVVATSGIPQHSAVTGARGNLTSVTLPTGNGYITQSATYYDTGQPTSTTSSGTPSTVSPAQAFTTTYGYDSTQTYVTSQLLPVTPSNVSLTTKASYDASSGVLISVSGVNAGQTTTYAQYDALLRPTSIQYPDGGATTVNYLSPNEVEVVQAMSQSESSDSHTQYDGLGRVSRTEVANGQSTNPWYQVDYCYDASGLLQFQSLPYQGNGWATAKQCSGSGTSYTYDALGRITSVTNGDGTATTQYLGGATKTTDVNGIQKIIQMDLLGRIVSVCEVSPSGGPDSCGGDMGGAGILTTFAYNPSQHLVSVSQGTQTRTFQTDETGRLVSTTEPERGSTTYTYSYNSTGLVITRSRPQANQVGTLMTHTTTQYDALGRVLSITYDDGLTPSRYFAYDSSAGWAEGQSGVAGMLSHAWTNQSGGQTGTIFSYDQMGRTTQMYECLPSGCGTPALDKPVSQNWDLAGNLSSLTDNVSGMISYGRSPAGEVLTVSQMSYTDQYNTPNLVSNVVNGPNGPLTYSLGNGLSQANSYDPLGRLSGSWICGQAPSVGCANQVYGFYKIQKGAQVSSSSDDVTGQGTNYTYDEFNRLSASNYGNGQQTFSYTYDRWGNRISQSAPQGGPAPSYSFDGTTNHNRSMGYDAAGNVINDGLGNSYQYDAEGNVLSVSGNNSSTYTYDALNHRVRVQTGSQTEEYTFDAAGQRTGTWIPGTNTGTEGRIYWGGRQIAFRDQDGTTYFDHRDWLGTERMRTNWAGQIANTYTSLPFGDGYGASSPGAASDQDPSHFAGLDADVAATQHAQFRQYSQTSGQWLSPDPYDGSYDPTNPQSFNRYTYVLNNPLGAVDPTGRDCAYNFDDSGNVYVSCEGIIYDNSTPVPSFGFDSGSDAGTQNGPVSDPPCTTPGCGEPSSPNDPTPSPAPTSYNWSVTGLLPSGGAGSPQAPTSSGAPINVPSLINNAKGLLSQRCKSKFGQKIPGYTTSRFFNTLSNATINQYPFATPPQDASSYGADAVTHPPGGPIDLLPNFYGRDPTSQAFVLIHEGIHLFGRGNLGDSAVQNLFGLPVTGNTENITQYIAAGCYP